MTAELDRSAGDERADIARLTETLRQDLTAKGLQFNDVDTERVPGGAGQDQLLPGLEGQVRRRSLEHP